jgi:phosphatidate cytidylyltransferase
LLLTRVLTAAVLVAALLAALFLLPMGAFQALVALIVAVAAWEWSRLCGIAERSPAVTYTVSCLAAYGVVLAIPAFAEALFWVAGAFWLLAVPAWLARGLARTPASLLAIAGLLVIVPAAGAMALLERAELLALIGLCVIADTAAYFTGRAFGRRKLAPNISPGKTWEGAFGGAVSCIFYAIILTMFHPGLGARVTGVIWLPYAIAASLLCALSVLGDLFESALKRRAGVKDSGKLLPGHGGILDRIDSATAVLPAGTLLLHWLGTA